MSEYQYYEFRAIDRPLTPDEVDDMRGLSSRAEITPTRFTNTYNWGDFRGDPDKLMESYFDAHVYVSNFGIVNFMLRFPRVALPETWIEPYAIDVGLQWRSTDEHIIVSWSVQEEPRGVRLEGEGWMDRLLPIRDELIRGDLRSLYIGWLSASVFPGDDDNPDEEPPVPAGLGKLTAAQSTLAEFVAVTVDVIAAAAEASPAPPAAEESAQRAARWVEDLPERDLRSAVARMVTDEGIGALTELKSRYYRFVRESANDGKEEAGERRRTAGEIARNAARKEQERKHKEREERERKERKEHEERERKRREYLEGLPARFSELWETADRPAGEKTGSAYEKATNIVVDMHAAYDMAGRPGEFADEFARFLDRHEGKPALVRRLREHGLAS